MPTVGNTTKPTSSQEWFGLNSVNQMAQLITMPAGGPWLITRVGAWLAGKDAGASVSLCVWNAAGTLLWSSAPFTAAGQAFALGNSSKYEVGGFSIAANGGQQFYIGWHRHSDQAVQNGRYSSGSHLHQTTGDSPVSLSGTSSDGSGGISAYVADYVTANAAPSAPALHTSGIQNNGRTVYLAWGHSDPDGNPQNDAHVEVAWDGNPGVQIDGWYMSGLGAGGQQSVWRTLPSGYNADTTYSYRVRTADTLAWGPWSGWQSFRPNTPPNVPTVNTPPTNTLTPSFTGGGSDPDGNSISSFQVEVSPANAYSQLWLSGEGAFSGIPYGGPALNWGGPPGDGSYGYAVRGRIKDQWGAWGAWSGWVYWTPVQPTGPTLTPNTTAVKQNTLTPNLTITHGSSFTQHELAVYTAAGTLVYEESPAPYTATTSKIVVPNNIAWGQQYQYRARVLVDGVWTAWSQYASFKVNAEPTAPTLSMPGSTISPSGERVVTTLTPTLRAVFNDADKVPYGDAPTAASLEVRNNATDALIATLTATAEDVVYNGAALAWMTTYKWRKRYTDDAGRQGPFSDYQVFRPTRAPTAGVTSPANASVVVDSTPLLDWSFSSLDGKAQYSYRVKVFDKGPIGTPNFRDAALATSPALYWRLNEPSGTVAADSSGNGRTGAIAGSVGYAAPSLLTRDDDKGMEFNAVAGEQIRSGTFAWGTAFAEACWYRPDVSRDSILLMGYTTGGTQPYLRVINGRPYFNFVSPGGAVALYPAAATVTTGVRHLLLATHDGTTARLYVDGAEVGSLATATNDHGTRAFQVGNFAGVTTYVPDGVLDEVLVWQRNVTAAEVASLWAAGTDPTGFATEVQVYDSGERVSADTQFALPYGVLQDDRDYRWVVEVKDTDGLTYELA